MPPTTVLSGTSLDTTAPAATIEFSPTVTPGKMVQFAPSQAFRLMRIGLVIKARLSIGSAG